VCEDPTDIFLERFLFMMGEILENACARPSQNPLDGCVHGVVFDFLVR